MRRRQIATADTSRGQKEKKKVNWIKKSKRKKKTIVFVLFCLTFEWVQVKEKRREESLPIEKSFFVNKWEKKEKGKKEEWKRKVMTKMNSDDLKCKKRFVTKMCGRSLNWNWKRNHREEKRKWNKKTVSGVSLASLRMLSC